MKIEVDKELFSKNIHGFKYYDWYAMASYIIDKYIEWQEKNDEPIDRVYYISFITDYKRVMKKIETGNCYLDNFIEMVRVEVGEYPPYENKHIFDVDVFDGEIDVVFKSVYSEYDISKIAFEYDEEYNYHSNCIIR
jgi:hypothetical protein